MGVSKNEFVCQEISPITNPCSKSPKGKVIVNGPVGKLIPKMVKKKKKIQLSTRKRGNALSLTKLKNCSPDVNQSNGFLYIEQWPC